MADLKEKFSMIFFGKCKHSSFYSQTLAFLYCLGLAFIYVGALYIMVPGTVRRLDRDHPRHIKYRVFSSLITSAGAIASYPVFFCSSDKEFLSFALADLVFSPRLRPIIGVLIHTIILYFGSIVTSVLRVSQLRTLAMAQGEKQGSLPEEILRRRIQPTLLSLVKPNRPEDRWMTIRNLIVAPWTEEVVFRGCMVPALLGSGMSPLKVSMLSPLCFGVAHVHHAMTRLSKGERLQPVILITAFQFLYTSLFGSYAAYAFIRTGSVTAITMSHVFCNWMGLPDFNFVQPNNLMYPHRKVLLASFVLGVFGFKWAFSSGLLLPLPPSLPPLVQS